MSCPKDLAAVALYPRHLVFTERLRKHLAEFALILETNRKKTVG